MPKILLLGKQGQVGWELARSLADVGQIVAPNREELDLADLDGLRRRVAEENADFIVNAAAYTDADSAETDRSVARAVNTEAPSVLAKVAERQKAHLIHFSTDYVFDGDKGTPYSEGDPAHPINYYGQSKLDGEQAIASVGGAYWIFRTSWVYSTRRSCFLTKVLSWARQEETLRIAEDQWGSPTWSRVVAEATRRVLEASVHLGQEWRARSTGIYHLACSGSPSRLDWARAILANDPHPEDHVVKDVIGVPSSMFHAPAERPRFTALDCTRFESAFGIELPFWESALAEAIVSG
jgi:dTDP-4-dehydrorhamnose reductase